MAKGKRNKLILRQFSFKENSVDISVLSFFVAEKKYHSFIIQDGIACGK